MVWGSSIGRTFAELALAAVVAAVVGSALFAVEISLIVGAALVTASVGQHDAALPVASAGLVAAIVVNTLAVALVAALPIVALARASATRVPRAWPGVLAGLVAGGAYWGVTAASSDGVVLSLWPTHLASWLWIVAAEVVAVNLAGRPREGQ